MKHSTKLIPAMALAAALSGCSSQSIQVKDDSSGQLVASDGSRADCKVRYYRNPYLHARRVATSICKAGESL